jgi:hypothetical protein
MKKTIETYCPLFPGFYGTIYETDNLEDMELEYINEQRLEKGLDPVEWDSLDFDYNEYRERVSKGFVMEIEYRINGILGTKMSFVFEQLVSPKYYNFVNDSIDIQIKLEDEEIDKVKQYILDNKSDFEKYITEQYTSRDGFLSYYSNDVDVWVNEHFNEIETNSHIFGALLTFVLLNENKGGELYYEIYEGLSDVHFISVKNIDELIYG